VLTAEVALTANYEGGATAVSFDIPLEMVNILNNDSSPPDITD
jgi:hypothetical protein